MGSDWVDVTVKMNIRNYLDTNSGKDVCVKREMVFIHAPRIGDELVLLGEGKYSFSGIVKEVVMTAGEKNIVVWVDDETSMAVRHFRYDSNSLTRQANVTYCEPDENAMSELIDSYIRDGWTVEGSKS